VSIRIEISTSKRPFRLLCRGLERKAILRRQIRVERIYWAAVTAGPSSLEPEEKMEDNGAATRAAGQAEPRETNCISHVQRTDTKGQENNDSVIFRSASAYCGRTQNDKLASFSQPFPFIICRLSRHLRAETYNNTLNCLPSFH